MRSAFLLVSLFLFFQVKLWIGADGIIGLQEINRQILEQQKKNQQLVMLNQQLEQEIKSLKLTDNSQVASKEDLLIEDYARWKLGMIRKGEIFYYW